MKRDQNTSYAAFSMVEKVPSHSSAGVPMLQSGSHRKAKKRYTVNKSTCCLHTLRQILSVDHVCQNDKTHCSLCKSKSTLND